MKRLILAVAIIVLLPVTSTWAEPASEASLREYLRLTDFRRAVDPITATLNIQAARQLRSLDPGITDEKLQRVATAIHDLVASNIGGYEAAVISAYQDLMTEEEVSAANAFFSSPAGSKFAKKLPQFSQAAGVAGQQWINGLNPQIKQAIQSALSQ